MAETVRKLLDVENGIERLGGNRLLYIKLLRRFYDQYCHNLPQFERALSEETISEFHNEIHTLKGVSGNLAASALYESCSAFDLSLKSGHPDIEIYHQIEKVHQKTKEEVRRFLVENSHSNCI